MNKTIGMFLLSVIATGCYAGGAGTPEEASRQSITAAGVPDNGVFYGADVRVSAGSWTHASVRFTLAPQGANQAGSVDFWFRDGHRETHQVRLTGRAPDGRGGYNWQYSATYRNLTRNCTLYANLHDVSIRGCSVGNVRDLFEVVGHDSGVVSVPFPFPAHLVAPPDRCVTACTGSGATAAGCSACVLDYCRQGLGEARECRGNYVTACVDGDNDRLNDFTGKRCCIDRCCGELGEPCGALFCCGPGTYCDGTRCRPEL